MSLQNYLHTKVAQITYFMNYVT